MRLADMKYTLVCDGDSAGAGDFLSVMFGLGYYYYIPTILVTIFTKFENFLNSSLGENTHIGHTVQWFHQSTLEYQLFFPRYLGLV